MRTIAWEDGVVVTIDQSKLPNKVVWLKMRTAEEVAEAVKNMKIRGAPLIGVAVGYALALTAYNTKAVTKEKLLEEIEEAAKILKATRPTAVNLFWAVNRILRKAKTKGTSAKETAELVVGEAQMIADEDAQACRRIGVHGSELLENGDVILTHCNAGSIATVEYGTALGVIRMAWKQGKKIKVVATETRPKLQGARLTTYELHRDRIPVTLIADGMVGYVISKGLVDKVIVGADRIVKDAVINKIGTYTIAVVAHEHNIPFYVAAPKSTFDLFNKAENVVIEEREQSEVTHFMSRPIAPKGVKALNPAFDITPLRYVTAIISEEGIITQREFRAWSGRSN